MLSNKKGKNQKKKLSSALKKNEYANQKEGHQSTTQQTTIEETGKGLLSSINAKRRNGIERYTKLAVPH